MTIEELREIMAERRLTQSDIAKMIGTGQQAVGQWFTRKEIPLKWRSLLKSKLIEQQLKGVKIDIDHYKTLASKNSDDLIDIRKIANISVSAGSGYAIDSIDEYSDIDTLQISQYSIPSCDVTKLRAIRVDGKSMLPTLMPDEYVIIDIGQKRYVGDGLYVVNYGGNLLVKRLQYIPLNGGTIEIISDNPEYKSYKLVMNDDQTSLYIVGRVIAQVTR